MTSHLPLCIALLGACGDPGSQSTDAPTADSAIGTPDASVDAPAIDAPAIDAPMGNCPAGQLCLRLNPVVAGATIPAGRLVVVFYQFIDNITPPPPLVVAYDAPFDGTTTAIQFPLANIATPAPIDDYRLCPRTCFMLSNPTCDCPAASAKITTAFVFVMRDANSSGAIEPAELIDANRYGIGFVQIGGADMAYPNPQALQNLLPDGIQNGLAPYRVIDLSPFDKMGVPAPGTVFELDVCVPNSASCSMVRFPNFT